MNSPFRTNVLRECLRKEAIEKELRDQKRREKVNCWDNVISIMIRLGFQDAQTAVNKAAAASKKEADNLKMQVLKFLQVLGFAGPTSQRLSIEACRTFARRNERHLWPHRIKISEMDMQMDEIIKMLKAAYTRTESICWSTNIKNRAGTAYATKTMTSFTQFQAADHGVSSSEQQTARSLFQDEHEGNSDEDDGQIHDNF